MLLTFKGATGPTLLLALSVVLAAPPALADEIHVPADAPTIQAAVDLAQDGDTILLAPGTYAGAGNIAVEITGKAVHIVGTGGADACVLDPAEADRALLITETGTQTVTITGVTIRNARKDVGSSKPPGQAVFIENADVRFENCVLRDNGFFHDAGFSGTGPSGGAVYVSEGDLTLVNCLLEQNRGWRGGAVFAWASRVRVERCVFSQNRAELGLQRFSYTYEGYGGAMSLAQCSEVLITDSVFRENRTADAGGALWISTAQAAEPGDIGGIVRHCTFYGNFATEPEGSAHGEAIAATTSIGSPREQWFVERCIADQAGLVHTPLIEDTASPTSLFVSDSNVKGGHAGLGNTRLTPGFVDPQQGDLRLAPWSPLIDALEVTDVTPYLRTDIVGNPRLQDADLDGVTRADLGAYEFSNLKFTTQQTSGASFSARVTGTSDLEFAVWVGRSVLETPVFMEGQGLHLVDLLPGAFVLVPPGTIPEFFVGALPPGIPSGTTVFLQAFATDPDTGFGNTSAVATLTAP